MSATKENLPAIIPVSGMASEFGMEWDSSLIPVGPNYTAIEATIYECLHVGCNSIWIIANDDIAPLLRKRIGEYATDIRSLEQASFKQFGSDHHKEVPIYYVPIHPKHRNKVDNYAWSAIYGANVAFWIMRGFSRWTTPAAYYVSFPLGMMDPKELLKHRAKVQKKKPSTSHTRVELSATGIPLASSWSPMNGVEPNIQLPLMRPCGRLPPKVSYLQSCSHRSSALFHYVMNLRTSLARAHNQRSRNKSFL
jgi:hypothetical protein